MLSHIKITIIGIFSFLLVACDDSEYAALETGTIVNGTVVDGYIDNATVCLDINKNNICDDSEPTTNSDENGLFKFTNVILEESSFIPIIAYGGIDTATDKNFDGQLRTILDTSNISENSIVSPLTDLVTQAFLDTDMNSSDTLNNVKTEVANIFSIPRAEIEKDPMKDITLFIKTQELQHSKDMIQKVLEKNIQEDMSIDDKRILQENIKKKLLEIEMKTADIDTMTYIFTTLVYDITVPMNQIIFANGQLEEVSRILNSLLQETSLNIGKLDQLQNLIYNEQTKGIDNLVNSDSEDEIEIVKIEIPEDSIPKTIFNTDDAILDEQACLPTNSYNFIESSNSGLISDFTSGISLSSGYEKTTEFPDSSVKIFYPKIDERLLNLTTETQDVYKKNNNATYDYYFVFNKAWIKNENNIVYILTPQRGTIKPICYRYELNDTVKYDTEGTKVYR